MPVIRRLLLLIGLALSLAVPATLAMATSASAVVRLPLSGSVSIEADVSPVVVGETAQLSLVGSTGHGSVTYASADPSRCTVNEKGLVTAVTRGTCVVTAKRAGAFATTETASLEISVEGHLHPPVTISSDVHTLTAQQFLEFRASGLAEGEKFTVHSAKGSTCAGGNTHKVAMGAPGHCVFTIVTSGTGKLEPGTSNPLRVTVVGLAHEKVTLTAPSTSASPGTEAKLTMHGALAAEAFHYVVENPHVCSVEYSTVHYLTAGVCSISVVTEGIGLVGPGHSEKLTIHVHRLQQPPLELKLAKSSIQAATETPLLITIPAPQGTTLKRTFSNLLKVRSSNPSVCWIHSLGPVFWLHTEKRGTCTLSASLPQDEVWEAGAAKDLQVTVVGKTQAPGSVSIDTGRFISGQSREFTFSGGSGGGGLTYKILNMGPYAASGFSNTCSIEHAGVLKTRWSSSYVDLNGSTSVYVYCRIVVVKGGDDVYEPLTVSSDDFRVWVSAEKCDNSLRKC